MRHLDPRMRIANRVVQRRLALLLLPLRLWLGLAWLRSGLAKLIEPAWLDGTALSGFLAGQLEAGAPPIGPYAVVMESLWAPLAAPLGVLVLVAELCVGAALLAGACTNLALLSAIALNVNLILAGSPSPSQWYVLAELTLLMGGGAAYYGADRFLSLWAPSPWLTAQHDVVSGAPPPRRVLHVLAGVSGALALASLPSITAVLPAQGADDPAYAAAVVFGLVAVAALVVARSQVAAASARRSDPPAEPATSPADPAATAWYATPARVGPPRTPSAVAAGPVTAATAGAGQPFAAPASVGWFASQGSTAAAPSRSRAGIDSADPPSWDAGSSVSARSSDAGSGADPSWGPAFAVGDRSWAPASSGGGAGGDAPPSRRAARGRSTRPPTSLGRPYERSDAWTTDQPWPSPIADDGSQWSYWHAAGTRTGDAAGGA